MIAISDIPFSHSSQDENIHLALGSYKSDLVHFIRKKPTRKMRIVKKFLDANLKDPDKDAQILDRELSSLYGKYHDEQILRFSFINSRS